MAGSTPILLLRRKTVIVGRIQYLQVVVFGGTDASTALGGGARGTNPLGAASILHELDVAMTAVVEFDRFALTLGEEELGGVTLKENRYVTRCVSKSAIFA